MINNDVLRSVRYSLDLGDQHVVTLCQMADPAFVVDTEQVKAWLRREDEAGFEAMNDSALAHFLDGLIVHLRQRRFQRVQVGSGRAVPPTRAHQLPALPGPDAAQFPQGPEPAPARLSTASTNARAAGVGSRCQTRCTRRVGVGCRGI